MNGLIKRGAVVYDMIMNNGRLMSFSYHVGKKSPNKVFDLYLFTMQSLDSACKGFKIENQKSKFEHSKMKTWANVHEFRHEVEPYLKLDVMGLKELFETFNDVIYDIEKTNITKFLTTSHLAYSIWARGLDKVVEIPKCLEKSAFIGKAVFGGRCVPHQKSYVSKMFPEVLAGFESGISSKEAEKIIDDNEHLTRKQLEDLLDKKTGETKKTGVKLMYDKLLKSGDSISMLMPLVCIRPRCVDLNM
jgi:hypothetical protein